MDEVTITTNSVEKNKKIKIVKTIETTRGTFSLVCKKFINGEVIANINSEMTRGTKTGLVKIRAEVRPIAASIIKQ